MKAIIVIITLIISTSLVAGPGGGGGGTRPAITAMVAYHGIEKAELPARSFMSHLGTKIIIPHDDIIDVQLQNGDLLTASEIKRLPNVRKRGGAPYYEINLQNNQIYDLNTKSQGIVDIERLIEE